MHYGIRKRKMERVAAKELAEEFGFSRGELNQEVSALSAGAKQRLAFANSRAIDTRIYILDNIMSHVDYESQEMLYDKMEELKKNGVSFLVIGREFEELRMVSDRIIYVMDQQISDRWFY